MAREECELGLGGTEFCEVLAAACKDLHCVSPTAWLTGDMAPHRKPDDAPILDASQQLPVIDVAHEHVSAASYGAANRCEKPWDVVSVERTISVLPICGAC